MALLDQAAVAAGVSTAGEKAQEAPAVSKGASYQRKQKEKLFNAGTLIAQVLKRANVQLSKDEQAALDLLTKKPGSGVGRLSSKPLIFKIFGDEPKVGSTKTAIEILEITNKGYNELKQVFRKWEEKHGTIVEYEPTAKKYTITKLGTLPEEAKSA